MVDLKKSFGYAKMSIAAYVGIWLVVAVLNFIPVINLLGAVIGTLQFIVINPILLAYAGYLAVKGRGDIADGAAAGAIAGFGGSLAVAVLTFLLFVGVGAAAAQGYETGAVFGAVLAGLGALTQLAMVVVITIAGFVLGAIGAFIGQSMGGSKKK